MTEAFPDLPTYTETDDGVGGLTERIDRAKGLGLPIMKAPQRWSYPSRDELLTGPSLEQSIEIYHLQIEIVDSFFSSITKGRDDVVADFIARGYVSPDTTDSHGETPLLAAVRVNNLPMISKLVSLGATVDGYGRTKLVVNGVARESIYQSQWPEQPLRTPLQYAAQEGKLALVKVFMEDYGADDALVAPDGALALRLAAMNGHREIVEYLPVRRGGAWKRWKTAHAKEMKIVKRALHKIKEFILVFVWHIPKFLVWTVPKETGKSIRKSCKWAWDRRNQFGGWCKRQVTEFPGRVKRATTKLAKKVWSIIKDIPKIIKAILKGIWQFIKGIPKILKIIAEWIGHGIKSFGMAIWNVIVKFVSFLHTIFSAIVSFFKRITLKDIWNGFVYVLRAIFVETPKAIGKFIVKTGEVIYDVLEGTLGCVGICIYYLAMGIIWLVKYIPTKLWQIIAAMGRSMGRGYEETMAYFNPKRI